MLLRNSEKVSFDILWVYINCTKIICFPVSFSWCEYNVFWSYSSTFYSLAPSPSYCFSPFSQVDPSPFLSFNILCVYVYKHHYHIYANRPSLAVFDTHLLSIMFCNGNHRSLAVPRHSYPLLLVLILCPHNPASTFIPLKLFIPNMWENPGY